MEVMKTFKDKQFDLAIVDPPYGIGIDGQKEDVRQGRQIRKAHDFKGWDNAIPSEEYFIELKRVSRNQIIWGGNYFTKFLPPTKAWIFWYKGQQGLTMSDGEMAWTSFDSPVRLAKIHWCGSAAKHETGQNKIHPTQKPIKLYKWLLQNYAKDGDTILDTHFGSLSIGIACHDLKFDLTAIELDKDYYEMAKQRLFNHQKQLTLF
jgi:site-specific DNA-methyltransferase (adenine-specific)